MKPHTLPVKRRPAPKGILKRLSAVTGSRKQRVAATVPADMESDDSSSKISRALTIIFLIHIVAIGLIFVHQKFLDGRPSDETQTAKTEKEEVIATPALSQRRSDLPQLSSGEKVRPVSQGDNYARIAKAEGVDEADLRFANVHKDIRPGMFLKIPPQRIVAVESPEVSALRGQARPASDGLVDAVDVSNAPRAQLVRPNVMRGAAAATAPTTASGKTYVVQNGDSVWRIANRFKVNQDALMNANGISDARKMKVGMSLTIPN